MARRDRLVQEMLAWSIRSSGSHTSFARSSSAETRGRAAQRDIGGEVRLHPHGAVGSCARYRGPVSGRRSLGCVHCGGAAVGSGCFGRGRLERQAALQAISQFASGVLAAVEGEAERHPSGGRIPRSRHRPFPADFGPLAAGEVGDPYVVVSVDCRYQRHMKSPHRRLGAKANPLLVPLLVSAIHGSETPRLAHSRGLHRCGHAIDDIDSGPSAPRGTCGILRHGRCDGDIIPVVGAPDIARGVD